MKKVILGGVLCIAAVALGSPANADATSDFWALVVKDISDLLIGPAANAGSSLGGKEFLSGSTNALILGVTGEPTPNAAYIGDGTTLYLDPNGYDGTTASTLALTTPETYNFATSVPQGETILENAILADYHAGDMGCHASGVCSDPLTIFTFSQSSAVAALAEQQLADDKIPTEALRFVMLGANPVGVPDNLYPTEIYDIHGDTWAEPGTLGTTWQDLLLGMELHDAYLGLTPAEIDSATTLVYGLTNFHDIPTLNSVELWEALFSAASAGSFSISG